MTVGFKELSWLLRIIVTIASDYDDDNDGDIGISFSIQYLEWQWDLLTEPIHVVVHTWQWHWLYWILTVWNLIIFSLVNIFRWVENKKVADRLIELRDNIRQLSKFWDKIPKSKHPQSTKKLQKCPRSHQWTF